MTELLRTEGLTCGYGDLMVVRDVAVRVKAGSITAVLGRNGAGKTTLLRAIAGLIKPRSGEIAIAGRSVTKEPPYARRGMGVGFVQENKRIFKQRTVEQNLMLALYGAGLTRVQETERMAQAYGRFPILGERRGVVAGLLSGGQQQMLAIAQALASRPALLLLDEPSAGLAPSIVSEVMGVVRGLRDAGLGVLLVEQAVDSTHPRGRGRGRCPRYGSGDPRRPVGRGGTA